MKKLNKRGLSGIVTTILLIMLILISLGVIWTVVNNLLQKSSEKISTDSFALDLEIVSAKINFSSGMATVKVKRNGGTGDIIGIKFLVEDDLGSDVFEKRFSSFEPLEQRTFNLDLTQSEFLTLLKIHKISIASIYLSETGATELMGGVSDSVDGLNSEVGSAANTTQVATINYCETDSDCPLDTPIPNTAVCNLDNTQVFETITTWSCSIGAGVCTSDFASQVKTTCIPEEHCSVDSCIPNIIACTQSTVATDCGIDGLIGSPECSITFPELVVQSNQTYTCTNQTCSDTSLEVTIENCTETNNASFTCYNGACVVQPECTSDFDCNPEDFCNDSGVCELEMPLNNGTVASIWPFGKGEFFDSPDLPTSTMNGNYGNNYIIFPQSAEKRCLALAEHVYPENNTNDNAYVRMNETDTNITSGMYYEIWQRNYICSVPNYYQ